MALCIDLDRCEVGIGRQQADAFAIPMQALDGDLVVDAGDDDATVLGRGAAMHGDEVAIEDAGITHAQALHAQQIVGAWTEQFGIDRVLCFDVLGSEDGAAGGDPPDEGKQGRRRRP